MSNNNEINQLKAALKQTQIANKLNKQANRKLYHENITLKTQIYELERKNKNLEFKLQLKSLNTLPEMPLTESAIWDSWTIYVDKLNLNYEQYDLNNKTIYQYLISNLTAVCHFKHIIQKLLIKQNRHDSRFDSINSVVSTLMKIAYTK